MLSQCTIIDCTKPAHKRGWCYMHYGRWYTHGSTDPVPVLTPEQRFWAQVQKSPGCWLWTGYRPNSRTGRDYGRFTIEARRIPSHRYAWELVNGPIPPGMLLCHRCDTPPCVRPDHLFLGTNVDNMADMLAKGRSCAGDRNASRKYPDRRAVGEAHVQAVLTWASVDDIRYQRMQGVSLNILAAQFGVSKTLIKRIEHGLAWPPHRHP